MSNESGGEHVDEDRERLTPYVRRIRVCLLGLAMGCGDAEEHPDLPVGPTLSGQHVVVTNASGKRLCAGSMAYMDEFVVRTSKLFSFAPPTGDARIHAYWLPPSQVEEFCDADVPGCTRGDVVFTSWMPLNHELVHAMTHPLGRSLPLLEEGLAVAHEGLSGDLIDTQLAPGTQDIRILADLSALEIGSIAGGYTLAGAFSASLIAEHGIDRYLDLYAMLDVDADPAAIESAFLGTLGRTFEEVAASFEKAHPCAHVEYDAKSLECSAPGLAWDGDQLRMNRSIECEQADVVGPFADRITALYTVNIEEDGRYELRLDGDDQESASYPDLTYNGSAVRGVSMVRCGGCGEGGFITTREGDRPRALSIRAGRYSLRLHAPVSERSELGFSLTRVPDGELGALTTGGLASRND